LHQIQATRRTGVRTRPNRYQIRHPMQVRVSAGLIVATTRRQMTAI
jgi:hypothetical protein